MNVMKRLSMFIMGGLLLGAVVASLIAPAFLVSQNSGVDNCDCATVTRLTASGLIQWQLIAGLIGGAVALLLGVVVSVRGRKKTPAVPEEGTTRTTPPPV